jgi:hypothetical protein
MSEFVDFIHLDCKAAIACAGRGTVVDANRDRKLEQAATAILL